MVDVAKLGPLIGAEVSGVNISTELSVENMSRIEKALAEHSVIVFPNQKISPDQQLTFARRFGNLEINAFDKHALEGHPGILKVSNIRDGDKDVGYADAGSFWHSDMSYTDTPPRLTMLYALEIPMRAGKVLGNTLFASAIDAYDALSKEMKEKIQTLRAIHDFAAKKRGVKQPVKLSPEQIAKNPPVQHPIVRIHPITARKSIYVTADECTGIIGWDASESLPLLKTLSEHVVEPKFQYKHKWQVGDLLIWDNCAVQHVVDRNYQFPPDRRMLHRCTVNGATTY
jgi:taurine dioxygenase